MIDIPKKIPKDSTYTLKMRQLSTDLTRRTNRKEGTNNGPPRYRHPNLPPLFYLVKSRNWAAVIARCSSHPKEIVCVEDASGYTPLHFACRLNPPTDVIHSLMLGSAVKNNDGAIPLHVAASHRCSADVIKLLVNSTSTNETSPTLSLTKRGRTPLHYASLSFRGLSIEAFKILLEATIAACIAVEEEANKIDEEDFEWETCDSSEEQINAITMQDHFGQTPLSLLFKRYRERVRCVIRMLDQRRTSLSSAAAATAVNDELGGLWVKARLIVCLMAEKRREGHFSFLDTYEETNTTEAAIALEAARWASQRHQNICDDEEEEFDELKTGRKFRLVHSSVSLTGFGCPIEMIRLAISIYPNQVREMDEDGNLPLHIAAIASSFLPTCDPSPSSCSDEDSFISNLSNLSHLSSNKHPPFDRVIRMLLRSYKMAARIPNGQNGRLPLILAIDAKQRTMDDGLRALIEAYPAALETKNFNQKLYPHVLSLLGKPKQMDILCRVKEVRYGRSMKKEKISKPVIPIALYELLRAKPNLLFVQEDD